MPLSESTLADGAFESVDANFLRVGTKLRIPIYDEMDVLLLTEGYVITETFLDRLKHRGIDKVKVHESEVSRVYACQPQGTAETAPENHEGYTCPLQTEASNHLDQETLRGQMGLPPQGDAFANQLRVNGSAAYDDAALDALVEKHDQAVSKIETVFEDMDHGQGLNVEALSGITDVCLADIAEDADLFACIGINPYSDRYPSRHCMHVSMLAMAIGTQLGLDKKTLKELAVGCLIHDSGMLKIDPGVYEKPTVLDRITFLEITKHPILVFDMMVDMRVVSSRSAYIAYQIHERCNGSGYPRRREAAHIHFLSKVAAVADTYVGLVSPRPHRPALLPYCAMEKIIHSTHCGVFDASVVRGLLRTISLFPTGSFVELTDGRVGRVIRTHPGSYDRPVLEVCGVGNLQTNPATIDLLEESETLKVARPLAHLP